MLEPELAQTNPEVAQAIRAAQGSVQTNTDAECGPGRRHDGGCEHVDVTEVPATARAKEPAMVSSGLRIGTSPLSPTLTDGRS